MITETKRRPLLSSLLLGAIVAIGGCGGEETTGEKVDKAIEDAGKKADDAADKLGDKIQDATKKN